MLAVVANAALFAFAHVIFESWITIAVSFLGGLIFAWRYAVTGWFAFMLSLMFGHYILQEWSAVNQMLNYIFLGLLDNF